MVVYMDIVKFLKPQYILMENVVDLLKFSSGFLARHAMSRLISMDYQVRMGIMTVGSFGLPQFWQHVFLWGAQLRMKLPPYPLPTHEVVVRGGLPNDFERCLIAYDDISKQNLDKALLLSHALLDLPQVGNDAMRDAIPCEQDPLNGFQQYIRLNKTGLTALGDLSSIYDGSGGERGGTAAVLGGLNSQPLSREHSLSIYKQFVDAHNLMPKIMPAVKSIDFVSGDGGAGSIQQVNFVNGYQMKCLKNRLDFKDKENCVINYTAVESYSFGDKIDYISSEVKFDAAPDGGSKCSIKTTVCPKGEVALDEETLKAGKQGHMEQYQVGIAHLIENPHLYA